MLEQEFIKLNFERDQFKKRKKENFYIEKGLIIENTTINGMEILTGEDMMDTDMEQDFSDVENEKNEENNDNKSEVKQNSQDSDSDFEEIS